MTPSSRGQGKVQGWPCASCLICGHVRRIEIFADRGDGSPGASLLYHRLPGHPREVLPLAPARPLSGSPFRVLTQILRDTGADSRSGDGLGHHGQHGDYFHVLTVTWGRWGAKEPALSGLQPPC